MKISKIYPTDGILGAIVARGGAIFFLIFWGAAGAFPAGAQAPSNFLHVDQFGYLPEAAKIAVIADPQTGFNANTAYTPGASIELRRTSDDVVVFATAPQAWNGGATDPVSGDKAWWFDFSSIDIPGEYYVADPANNARSAPFRIAGDVYSSVMRTALRTFYYQRCGVAKPAAFAGAKWTDLVPCHLGAGQDVQCRLYTNPVQSTERNLSGGWHDAGDYNKYVNFALNPVLNLASAYLEHPDVFSDDYGLPESGNGVPDLLDELKWELDWLLKMQAADGGVFCVVGGGSQSPPSADGANRRYGPQTTAASYSAAAMYAIGSRAYSLAGNTAYAAILQNAAVNAWTWAETHPGLTFFNSGKLAAGEQEPDAYGLYVSRLCAAVYLYDMTGEAQYKNWIENNYTQHHLMQWTWASMYEVPSLDALLYFSSLPGVNTGVANQIRSIYTNSLSTAGDHLGGFNSQSDPYRAWLNANNYVWGSNQIKAQEGIAMMNMISHGLNAAQAVKFRTAAAGYLHYLHGVNPFSLCYLTNMAGLGAENSAREMYHVWFGDGTDWDNADTSPKGPAPGYLTGGPNRYFSIDGCCPTNCGSTQNNALCSTALLQPPLNQPAMKAYKDWNTSWPQNSWQITEPAIYYQAAYVRLLSNFIQTPVVGVAATQKIGPDFNLLPNPATQFCRVRLNQELNGAFTVRLVNMAGQVVLEEIVAGIEVNLDLGGVPAGLYFVQVQTEKSTGIRRLAVN